MRSRNNEGIRNRNTNEVNEFPVPTLPKGIPEIDFELIIMNKDANDPYDKNPQGTETIVNFKGNLMPITREELKYSDGVYTNSTQKIHTDDSVLDKYDKLQNYTVSYTITSKKKYTIMADSNHEGMPQTSFRILYIDTMERTAV